MRAVALALLANFVFTAAIAQQKTRDLLDRVEQCAKAEALNLARFTDDENAARSAVTRCEQRLLPAPKSEGGYFEDNRANQLFEEWKAGLRNSVYYYIKVQRQKVPPLKIS